MLLKLLTGLFRQGLLALYPLAVDHEVVVVFHDVLNSLAGRELHKSKAAALLRVFVRNNHTVHDIPIYRKKLSQRVGRQLRRQSAHKDFGRLELGVCCVRIYYGFPWFSLLAVDLLPIHNMNQSGDKTRGLGLFVGDESEPSALVYEVRAPNKIGGSGFSRALAEANSNPEDSSLNIVLSQLSCP